MGYEQVDGEIASHVDLDATVFMGVGALGKPGGVESGTASDVLALEQKLLPAGFSSLHLSRRMHLFPDEMQTRRRSMSFAAASRRVWRQGVVHGEGQQQRRYSWCQSMTLNIADNRAIIS